MKYEAIVNFEVRDEDVDILGLVKAAQKIDLSGVDLIGRTHDGEVTEELTMFWAERWTGPTRPRFSSPRPPKTSSGDLKWTRRPPTACGKGGRTFYETMAGKDLCAYPGGEQSLRVISEALEFIRRRADAMPEED
jgi:hypothetical protein